MSKMSKMSKDQVLDTEEYVWFPITSENGIVTGLKTIPERNASQECSICYYDSANESEQNTDAEDNVGQDTLHHTHRYSQMYKWSSNATPQEICSHQFHTICLYQWFETSNKMQCPICKQGIPHKVQLPPLIKKPPRFVTLCHENGVKKICYFEVNGQKHGPYEKFDKEGRLIIKRNYYEDQLHGYEYEYYPYTGKIRCKTKYSYGKRDGKHWTRTSQGFWILKSSYRNDLLHGHYQEWYEGTHILKKGCTYEDGELHGVLREWDQKQNLLMYATYNHGVQWGRYMENYAATGTPAMKCFFNKQGLMHGMKIEYFKNKDIKSIEYFNNGNPVQYEKKIYSNGQIACTGEYYNGLRDGQWLQWYRDGLKKMESTYEDGNLFGTYTRYSERGDPIESAEYYENELHGKHIVYHPNNTPHIVEHYRDGQLNGPRVEFDKQGKPSTKVEYKNGIMDGLFYDLETGIKCRYKDGVLHGQFIQNLKGMLLLNANFENGVMHGDCTRLCEGGQYVTTKYYNGEPME